MKKILSFVLICVMLLGCLTACGSSGKSLDDIKKAGKLVVATSPDFPPFVGEEGGKLIGIEVELVDLIGKELGVQIQTETMDFDAILAGVQAGRYDMGYCGISVDEDRKKNMDFTDPYCLAAQAIVVVEGSSIKGKADLTGKKIAVQSGTTAAKNVSQNGYVSQEYAVNSDAQLALTTGKVDAWIIDDLTAAAMVKVYNEEHEENKLVILDEPLTTEPYALAFIKGSDTLVAEVNKILNKMLDDGTIKALFDKYDAPYTAPKK